MTRTGLDQHAEPFQHPGQAELLRRGLVTLPTDQRDDHARGLILAFVVDDLEGELARLESERVAIMMPLTEEDWGERAFQVRDPNGVIVQLVDWNGAGSSDAYGQ